MHILHLAAPCRWVPVTFTLDITSERLMEFNRSERKTLRELASEVFEAEACDVLADLAASFAEWRKKKRLSSDFLADIRSFHQDHSQRLWATYQNMDDSEVVARGVAFGFIPEKKVPRQIAEKLNLDGWRRIAQETGE